MNEPAVIALNSRTGAVLAMGHEAWQLSSLTVVVFMSVMPTWRVELAGVA